MRNLIYSFVIFCVLMLAAPAQDFRLSPAQASLVAAERAFAKLSVEKGVREAFLTWFADDGVNFQPHPVNTREFYRKQPATASPVMLNWAPTYGDVSQAGDLGYSTGPYVLEDRSEQKRPARHGMFFSVWKKQPGGDWKVALDCGIQTPSAVAPLDAPFISASLFISPSLQSRGLRPAPLKAMRHPISQLDETFFKLAKSGGLAAAFRMTLDDNARIYRWNQMPVVGSEVVKKWTETQTASAALHWSKAGVAESGDLAYSYGSFEERGQAKTAKGYYVHIWKLNVKGQWRIVFDIGLPQPEEKQ